MNSLVSSVTNIYSLLALSLIVLGGTATWWIRKQFSYPSNLFKQFNELDRIKVIELIEKNRAKNAEWRRNVADQFVPTIVWAIRAGIVLAIAIFVTSNFTGVTPWF
jgi:hypothetical protein